MTFDVLWGNNTSSFGDSKESIDRRIEFTTMLKSLKLFPVTLPRYKAGSQYDVLDGVRY